MKSITKYFIGCGAFVTALLPNAARAMGSGPAAVFSLIFVLFMLIFWTGILLLWIFWLLMIIDIAKREWKSDGDRAAYLLLVILLNLLGAVIYYFAVKRHLDKK